MGALFFVFFVKKWKFLNDYTSVKNKKVHIIMTNIKTDTKSKGIRFCVSGREFRKRNSLFSEYKETIRKRN